ncbi:hypothetical protein LXL04_030545 [Taraxacum kok-saghyz]
MQFGASVLGGKSGALMDWNVSTTYKNLKDIETKSVMEVALIPNIEPIDSAPGTSEKGNHSIKPRKKTMTSVYLKFFETTPDGKTRRCKFCGQSYSISTATGNLGRHLSNRHPGYDKSDNIISTSGPQPIIVIKKPQTQLKTPHIEPDHLNWLLIKWLILASLPPSTLEQKWLSNSFKFLSPPVQIWSTEKFQAVLQEVFKTMREDIRCTLAHVPSKVSITLDFWTSYQQIYYMSVTCHWIDESWTFRKLLLDISRVPSPSGSSEIYHTLIKVLKFYNLESKVLSCTHDNSTNVVHACDTLKEDLDDQKGNNPFFYVPCGARTLNSVIDDGLRSMKSVVPKIREFVLEINSSSEMMEEFSQFTTSYQEGVWKFPLDVSCRWSGTYQMLDIARKAGKSMEMLIRKHEETHGRLLLNSAEKKAINIMHLYLEPFYKTTNDICTNRLPTLGLVLFFMDHISETIATCLDSRHSPDWLKTAAADMASRIRIYNDQVSNIFTYITAILDPRIKTELIPETLNLENHLEESRTHFVRNYQTTPFASTPTVAYGGQDLDEGGANVSFAEEIARKRRRASVGTAADELTQYLSEPPAAIATDVLEWWKGNSGRYPRLAVMARDFLAVQAAAVVPEEVFCSKGDEVERERESLPYSSMETVVCVRSWIESGMKLKYKSTEVDYERLMEMVENGGEAKHK